MTKPWLPALARLQYSHIHVRIFFGKYLLNFEWACSFHVSHHSRIYLKWKFIFFLLSLAEQNLYLTFCRLKRLHLPIPHFQPHWAMMMVKESSLMKNFRLPRLKKRSELYQIYCHGKFFLCMWEEVREKIKLEMKMKNLSNFLPPPSTFDFLINLEKLSRHSSYSHMRVRDNLTIFPHNCLQKM